MFKLWGKHIFPFSLPLPCIPEAGPGPGYQAAKALGSTRPAGWHESEAADGSCSSASIKQVPTGDWIAVRRRNDPPLGLLWGDGSVCGCTCVCTCMQGCVCLPVSLLMRLLSQCQCEFPNVHPAPVSVHVSVHMHMGVCVRCLHGTACRYRRTRG